jgi:hypothetical protein
LQKPAKIGQIEVRHVENSNGVFCERGLQELTPASVAVVDHAADTLRKRFEKLCGGKAIEAPLDDVAFNLLFDAGDADFEEFVEIGVYDAKEFEALEQGIGWIKRLIEHALIKFQPAQLTINEVGCLNGIYSAFWLHLEDNLFAKRRLGKLQNASKVYTFAKKPGTS